MAGVLGSFLPGSNPQFMVRRFLHTILQERTYGGWK